MGPGELIRHSLGRFVRIDLSPIAGHWNRWQLNGGPDEAEAAVMRQIARLVVLSEFPMTFTMGAPARDFILEASHDLRQPLAQPIVGAGLGSRYLSAFRSLNSGEMHIVVSFQHPQNLLACMAFTASLDVVLANARILDNFIGAFTGAAPRHSLEHYVDTHKGKMVAGEFWNELEMVRNLRVWELRMREMILLENTPPCVQEVVSMAFGGLQTHAEFMDRGWRPVQTSTPTPYSPCCFYLSDSGIRGSVEGESLPTKPRCKRSTSTLLRS